jgi:predicted SpoU family rRNA methylase
MKVVTVDGVERITSTWGEFWEVAKREHSEKRVELKESGEMDVHIDVYRNTVQARFNAS